MENKEKYVDVIDAYNKYGFGRFNENIDSIDRISIELSDYCNLNCARCSHFAPLAPKKLPDKEELTKDIIRLSEITQEKPISCLSFMGGEPLLNPELFYYVDLVSKHFPKTEICIITNALLLKNKDDAFYKSLSEYKVRIAISRYFVETFYKSIEEKLKEYNIPFSYIENATYKCQLFNNVGLKVTGYGLSKEEKFAICPLRNKDLYLYHGKIYSCATSAFLPILENYFHEGFSNEGDGIDIYSHDLNDVLDFLKQPKNTCKYCDQDCLKTLYFPEPSKKERSEWIKKD